MPRPPARHLTCVAAVTVLTILAASLAPAEDAPAAQEESPVPPALNFTVESITGEPVDLAQYLGDVVLIVNVASKCGHTKQYADLQALHEKYADRGLAILGFPCNQFKGQEPGSNEEIARFCRAEYGVEFDMFAKLNVNDNDEAGETAAPLFAYLTGEDCPVEDQGPVKWNFEKFLIDRQGNVVARYRTKVMPTAEEVVAAIEAALGPAETQAHAGQTHPATP